MLRERFCLDSSYRTLSLGNTQWTRWLLVEISLYVITKLFHDTLVDVVTL